MVESNAKVYVRVVCAIYKPKPWTYTVASAPAVTGTFFVRRFRIFFGNSVKYHTTCNFSIQVYIYVQASTFYLIPFSLTHLLIPPSLYTQLSFIILQKTMFYSVLFQDIRVYIYIQYIYLYTVYIFDNIQELTPYRERERSCISLIAQMNFLLCCCRFLHFYRFPDFAQIFAPPPPSVFSYHLCLFSIRGLQIVHCTVCG